MSHPQRKVHKHDHECSTPQTIDRGPPRNCARLCTTQHPRSRSGPLHMASMCQKPRPRSFLRCTACTARSPQPPQNQRCTACTSQRPVPQHTRPSTASSLRCRRTHDLPGMPRTRGSTTGSAHASRTPSMCRTGARRGTRGRSCPSAPQTCTDLAGTPPGAWSSCGHWLLLALLTPTHPVCTP